MSKEKIKIKQERHIRIKETSEAVLTKNLSLAEIVRLQEYLIEQELKLAFETIKRRAELEMNRYRKCIRRNKEEVNPIHQMRMEAYKEALLDFRKILDEEIGK